MRAALALGPFTPPNGRPRAALPPSPPQYAPHPIRAPRAPRPRRARPRADPWPGHPPPAWRRPHPPAPAHGRAGPRPRDRAQLGVWSGRVAGRAAHAARGLPCGRRLGARSPDRAPQRDPGTLEVSVEGGMGGGWGVGAAAARRGPLARRPRRGGRRPRAAPDPRPPQARALDQSCPRSAASAPSSLARARRHSRAAAPTPPFPLFSAAGAKHVYYLSAEFLMGRSLTNAVYNLGLDGPYGEAVQAREEGRGRGRARVFSGVRRPDRIPPSLPLSQTLGYGLEELVDAEQNASLGNGGLGRLAACFLDSMATLDLPGWGYGIRYKYGMFRQALDAGGRQAELPDTWLQDGNPWEVRRDGVRFPVGFYGVVKGGVWTPGETVIAQVGRGGGGRAGRGMAARARGRPPSSLPSSPPRLTTRPSPATRRLPWATCACGSRSPRRNWTSPRSTRAALRTPSRPRAARPKSRPCFTPTTRPRTASCCG